MSVETKRREILQMLAKGSITAEEASELLQQVAEDAPALEPNAPVAREALEPPAPPATPGKKARWLNVRVTDTDSGRDRVSVKIPLSLARVGLRMGAKFSPEVDQMDWEEILDQLAVGGEQTIVEVHDEDDGELVRVFVS